MWRIVDAITAELVWRIENGTAAQLSLVAMPNQSVAWRGAEQEFAGFALAVAEILADAARREALRTEQQSTALWPKLLAAEERWQTAETLAATAQAAVESLRTTLPADRVALLLTDQRVKPRWKLQAVSGAALLDRRGDHAAILTELVSYAAVQDEPLVLGQLPPAAWPAAQSENAPQALWQEYVDLTAVQGMMIIPWQAQWHTAPSQELEKSAAKSTRQEQQLRLRLVGVEENTAHENEAESDSLPRRGAWVCEWYRQAESTPGTEVILPTAQRTWLLQRAAEAVERNRRVENLPAIKLVRRWGRYRETWSARGVSFARLLALALVVLAALLVWLPVPFQITARARLWPVERREIFAPEDATVARVLVRHGERLTMDQPLLELTSPALDQQRAQLTGELATAQQRQASIRAERLRLRGDIEADVTRAQQLTAEEAELSKSLASSQAQLTIIDQRRAALVVRSPIAGQVLTWNVLEQLAGQPVRRGQLLLSLADPNQAWLAEGRIGEESVGYVRDALEKSGGAIPTQVRTLIDPKTVIPGTLRELSVRSETDPVWGTGVRATVSLEALKEQQTFSPGTEATLRIPCGERAWGFVLFRDVIDGVRRWW
jgi:biotin carboxyl carrier protein